MKIGSYRNTWSEISLDAIELNTRAFKKHINQDSKLMAVVKADGYGHGAVKVAKTAIEAGAEYLGVAFLDEALELREAGINAPILILGYTSPAAVDVAVEHDVTITVFTKEVIEEIEKAAKAFGKTARVHLKVDSGMNRIGIRSPEEALALCQAIHSPYVLLEGVFTHFADADNSADSTYTFQQFENFKNIMDYLEKHDVEIPIKHCCNSAATIAFPEMHLDLVRVGISLYGLYPSDHLMNLIALKQAMSFKTMPVMIKTVEAGDPISYGCTYSPTNQAKVATIPVGYADGLSRQLSNQGNVTIKGKRAPIVGRVCMDQSMIDITGVQDVDEQDVITIFGDPGDGFVSLAEVAQQMHTIHYETACLIGKRVPRVYIRDSQIV